MCQNELIRDARKARLERDRRYRLKLKRDCFEQYGGTACSIDGCTQENIDELELHHPDGDGNKDRAERVGRGPRSPGGWNFYQKLKRDGWPRGYVVICRDCHDKIHGRISREARERCAPGVDPSRFDDLVPF